MRFTLADWLRLILACIAASAAMSAVSRASWVAVGVPVSPLMHNPSAASRNIYFAVALALGLLHMPLNSLAAWFVLRSRVNGLRFTPWLAETAFGVVLGGVVIIPAMVFLLLVPGSVPPFSHVNPVGWLPAIAAGVAALLPPGLLLQRIGGVRGWPSLILVAAGMAAFPAVMGRTALHDMVPNTMLLMTFFPWQVSLGLAVAAVVMSGLLSGLVLGAGLFLMARVSRRADAP